MFNYIQKLTQRQDWEKSFSSIVGIIDEQIVLVLSNNLKVHLKAACAVTIQQFSHKATQVSINEPVREAKTNMFRAGKRGQCQKPFQMREKNLHVFLFRMSDVSDGTLKLFRSICLSTSSFLLLWESAVVTLPDVALPSSGLRWWCRCSCQRAVARRDLPHRSKRKTISSSTIELSCWLKWLLVSLLLKTQQSLKSAGSWLKTGRL